MREEKWISGGRKILKRLCFFLMWLGAGRLGRERRVIAANHSVMSGPSAYLGGTAESISLSSQ